VGANIGDASTVSVLGLAYKPGTPVIEESQSVMLCKRLLDDGMRVVMWDPLALEPAAAVLPLAEKGVSATEAVACADAVVIMTSEPEFATIPAYAFERADNRPVVVIDCWRVLKPETLPPNVMVIYPGTGPSDQPDSRAAAAAA
ncbi:MAG: UDP binding domain-containing protein, partial [Hyphomonadaceae bacterium]